MMDDAHPPGSLEPEPTSPPTEPAPRSRSNRSALLIVFLVVFIDLLGFGIVLPLLPLYADLILEPLYPRAGNAKVWLVLLWVPISELHGIMLGLLMSAYSFTQFLFAPLWGRLSDRLGRRPFILLGLTGSVVFYTLFGIASDVAGVGPQYAALGLILLFIARLGGGAAAATIGTAQAVIADTTTPENRARGMALIGAAFGIGFTFGPLLGFASLFLPLYGAPGYMAAGLSLAALLLAWERLPETLRAGSTGHLRRRLFDPAGTRRVLTTPVVGLLVITFFLATFAFGGLESTLSLVNKLLLTGQEVTRETAQESLSREAAKTQQINFLVFAYIGFVLMLIQGFVYRRFVKRVGEVPFLRAGVLLMALGLIGAVGVLLVRPSMADRTGSLMGMALAVMTVAVTGFALMTPSIQSLISRRTDPSRQGEVLNVNQSAAAMARILGPMVGISFFFLLPSHALPYEFGAALLFLVFFLSWRIPPAAPTEVAQPEDVAAHV
jgi:MFS family permease